jgi:hypothetical protein
MKLLFEHNFILADLYPNSQHVFPLHILHDRWPTLSLCYNRD